MGWYSAPGNVQTSPRQLSDPRVLSTCATDYHILKKMPVMSSTLLLITRSDSFDCFNDCQATTDGKSSAKGS